MTREEAVHKLAFMQQYYTWRDGEFEAFEMAIEALKADIVRCKDCKHWKWIDWAKEYRCTLRSTAFNTRADDFCSYGERRE